MYATPRRSARRSPSRAASNPRAGQAAIEFVVGLLLFLLLVTGIIHINRMARTSLFLHAVLRGDAGEQAMAANAAGVAPLDVSDWQAGTDQLRYTADDQPVRNGSAVAAALATLTGYSARRPEDWSYVVDADQLPLSMAKLQASPLAATALGLIHREETLHVPVDPVLRELVYDAEEVAIKEEVWMPLMGGLY